MAAVYSMLLSHRQSTLPLRLCNSQGLEYALDNWRMALPPAIIMSIINMYRIKAAGGKYQLWNWHGIGGSEYHVSAVEGVLISDQDNFSPF